MRCATQENSSAHSRALGCRRDQPSTTSPGGRARSGRGGQCAAERPDSVKKVKMRGRGAVLVVELTRKDQSAGAFTGMPRSRGDLQCLARVELGASTPQADVGRTRQAASRVRPDATARRSKAPKRRDTGRQDDRVGQREPGQIAPIAVDFTVRPGSTASPRIGNATEL